ncbi:hypothetical protein RhiXN_03277 [Rhizoctonia solani]|uniref:Uncharacterized protein n=1 Tax=Rhizoctonia solani TaxID=456999 RepID=A0A8H8NU35_9AGAM|nr:uncharacterized protein RhiXN_03277 [Rhizoctonia solani]QRW18353.1 hypothetical protein RhiXN_03277 [Rhizoctonia solani]
MSYVSPFLNPGQYITNLNNLSSESIAIDEGVARAVREAREFSNKYSSNFSHAAQLKDTLEQFEPRLCVVYVSLVKTLSIPIAYLHGPSEDAQDVIAEFQSFSSEERPTSKYQLGSTPGPKKAFEEIESLAERESKHVSDVLQDSNDWHKAIAELKKDLPNVQNGVKKIADALEKYATKLG